jgi:hypothetical protein
MKKFLQRLLLFALPLVVIWAGIELLYRTIPNNYSLKNTNVVKHYTDAEVLILGNSHSFFGINPQYFKSKAFNFSNVSQGLFADELLFNKHIERFGNLKYLILNVDYFTLSQKDNSSELEWRNYFYEAQMGIETDLVSNFDLKKYSLAFAPPFKVTVNSVQDYFLKGTLAECNSTGWAAKQGVGPDNSPRMGIIIAKKHEDGSVDFNNNIARLKRIIQKCKSKNIHVILVTMPVTSYYAAEVNKSKLEKIFKVCGALDSGYDNVQYINLFQDRRFNNSDFYDTDHLNTNGAKKCSKIINASINIPTQ